MTKKTLFTFTGSLILSAAITGAAQDTTTRTTRTTTTPTPTTTAKTTTTVTPTSTTKTTVKSEVVQNADGSYSVIEYPVGKEVIVDLMPNGDMSAAKGTARVMRMGDETTINFDLNGVGNNATSYYAYAVDPMGAVTYLGPVTSENGMAKGAFKTSLNQFMLVLSPNEGLTSLAGDTPVMFRSSVPKGFAVVSNRATVPTGDDKQVAGTQAVGSAYDVPLLGITGFEKGETEIRVKFSGDLEGLKGKAYINNSKEGVTKIKMRFDDMKMAVKQKRYVLWAVSPAKEYTKIGQVINTGKRQESEIRGETALKDFGLLVTVEDKDVLQPSGQMFSTFSINP